MKLRTKFLTMGLLGAGSLAAILFVQKNPGEVVTNDNVSSNSLESQAEPKVVSSGGLAPLDKPIDGVFEYDCDATRWGHQLECLTESGGGAATQKKIEEYYVPLETYDQIKAFIKKYKGKKIKGGPKFRKAFKIAIDSVMSKLEAAKNKPPKLKKLGTSLNAAFNAKVAKDLKKEGNKANAVIVEHLMIGPLGIFVDFDEKLAQMKVSEVELKGPCAGKLKVGDVITSANGKVLVKLPRTKDNWGKRFLVRSLTLQELATAIDQGEGVGKLNLGIIRQGTPVNVDISLRKRGTLSATYPFNCPKSDLIFTEACNFLLAGHKEKRWGFGEKMSRGVKGFETGLCGLALLAHPNRAKYMPAVHHVVQELMKVEEIVQGELMCPAYVLVFLSEYYLAEADPKIKSQVKAKLETAYKRLLYGAMPYGGWGHQIRGGIYGSGGYAISTSHIVMAIGAMSRCIEIDQKRMQQTFDHLNTINERGAISYMGAWLPKSQDKWDPANLPVGGEGVSRTGTTALGLSLMNQDPYNIMPGMKAYLSEPLTYVRYYLPHCCHVIGLFPCSMAIARLNPKAFRGFMDAERWFNTMGRRYDGELMLGPVFKKRLRHSFSKKYNSLKACGCMALMYGIGSGKLEMFKAMKPYNPADGMAEYDAWNKWLWHRKGEAPARIAVANPPAKPLPAKKVKPMTYKKGEENVFGGMETITLDVDVLDLPYKSVLPVKCRKTGHTYYIVILRSDDKCSWYKDGKLVWDATKGKASKQQRETMDKCVEKGNRVKITIRKAAFTMGWLRAHKLELVSK